MVSEGLHYLALHERIVGVFPRARVNAESLANQMDSKLLNQVLHKGKAHHPFKGRSREPLYAKY